MKSSINAPLESGVVLGICDLLFGGSLNLKDSGVLNFLRKGLTDRLSPKRASPL